MSRDWHENDHLGMAKQLVSYAITNDGYTEMSHDNHMKSTCHKSDCMELQTFINDSLNVYHNLKGGSRDEIVSIYLYCIPILDQMTWLYLS